METTTAAKRAEETNDRGEDRADEGADNDASDQAIDEAVAEGVKRCVRRVLALAPEKVSLTSRLMVDLGAESLDLVELMYLLEAEFSIRLEQDDLSLSRQLGLPEAELHRGEVLTPTALELLRRRHPDAGDLLREGITRRELAALLTVGEVARTVARKLAVTGEPRALPGSGLTPGA